MKEYMFYNRELIKQKIEEKREHIDFAECFIDNYYEDTCETIFEDGRYLINIDAEENILSNNFIIAGIGGSYKEEPTVKIHYKDGSVEDLPCYEIKNQVDVTKELNQFLEDLIDKGGLRLELRANRGIVNQLKHVLDKISLF